MKKRPWGFVVISLADPFAGFREIGVYEKHGCHRAFDDALVHVYQMKRIVLDQSLITQSVASRKRW